MRRFISDHFLLVLLVVAALAAVGYIGWSARVYRVGFPLDDAWIHQTYARNLAARGEWAFLPGRTSAGSTAPMWTVLLAFGHMIRIDPRAWAFALGTAALLATALVATRWTGERLGESTWVGLAVGLTVVLEWHLVWSAVSGMETILVAGLAVAVFAGIQAKRRSPFLIGLLVGVGVWIRPDALTLLGPAGWYAWTRPGRTLRSSISRVPAPRRGGSLRPDPVPGLPAMDRWPLVAEHVLRQAGRVRRPDPGAAADEAGRNPSSSVGRSRGLVGDRSGPRDLRPDPETPLVPPRAGALGRWLSGPVRPAPARGLPAWPVSDPDRADPDRPRMVRSGALASGWRRRSSVDRRACVGGSDGHRSTAVSRAGWSGVRAGRGHHRKRNGRYGALGRRLDADPEAVIAAHDIGALGYFGGRSLVDLAGLTDPDLIPILRDEKALAHTLQARQSPTS